MGVIHRDIKPDNILLSGGHAVVVDFGIAKAVGDGARLRRRSRWPASSLGTPAYMAPGAGRGGDDVDLRADVYALGAMLLEMLAGTPPFTGTCTQIAMAKLAKPAPSLATGCPHAPPALVALVDGCLARDAAGRPQTAAA